MLESPTPARRATVLLLLVVAGCVDAVGFAESGRYYVSFMSGNTTQLGSALGYHDITGAILPLGLIALFVAGVTMGALLVEKAGRHAPGLLLLVEAALLAAAWYGFGSPRPLIGLVLLPVAMGLANMVTLHDASARPGTTYATWALVKLGVALAGLGRDTQARDLFFYLSSWLALAIGALLGAWGRLGHGTDVLLAPTAVLVLLGLVDLAVTARRPA